MDSAHLVTDLKEFSESLHLMVLPSTVWAIHIDPEYQYIAVLQIQLNLTKFNISKGILLVFDEVNILINVSYFINNQIVYIPVLNSAIKTVSDLSHLIYVFHNMKLCPNGDKILECNKYVEFEKYETFCSVCLVNTAREEKYRSTFWKDFDTMQDVQNTSSVETVNENLTDGNNSCSEGKKESDRINLYNESVINNTTNSVEIRKDSLNLKPGFSCNKRNRPLSSNNREKQFLCNICSKVSNRRSVHQKHMRTHSDLKPNLCNICGKTFGEKYRMRDHLLTHSGERPFECKTCHKSFTKSYNLKIHQNTHSNVRSFICSTCGKAYTSSSNLSTHILSTHKIKKSHACTTCNMTFLYPRHLKLHMQKHTGEKPYKCSLCSKTFAKNIHLTIHMRTHTGEKPHICAFCGKGFTTTGNLKSHERLHHHRKMEEIK